MSKFPNCAPHLERRIKQRVVGRTHVFLAIVQPGFEHTAEQELLSCGDIAVMKRIIGGVEFSAKLEACYKAHLHCHTINRIIMRIADFPVLNDKQFIKKVADIPWELYLADGINVTCESKARKSWLYHTDKIDTAVCNGIQQCLAAQKISVSFDSGQNDKTQLVYARIEHDHCQLSLDCSGKLLHKRGQRPHQAAASIRETTAAAILQEARYSEYDVLLDPMCGAGTFSIETASMLKGDCVNCPDTFNFMHWPSFKPDQYAYIKKELERQAEEKSKWLTIYASDCDPKAVSTIRDNLEKAGLEEKVICEQRDFFNDIYTIDKDKTCLLVLNPPYGKRIKSEDLEALYRTIGDTIRNHYPNSGFAVIVPGIEFEQSLSLSYDRKIVFMNGGIRVAALFRDKVKP